MDFKSLSRKSLKSIKRILNEDFFNQDRGSIYSIINNDISLTKIKYIFEKSKNYPKLFLNKDHNEYNIVERLICYHSSFDIIKYLFCFFIQNYPELFKHRENFCVFKILTGEVYVL